VDARRRTCLGVTRWPAAHLRAAKMVDVLTRRPPARLWQRGHRSGALCHGGAGAHRRDRANNCLLWGGSKTRWATTSASHNTFVYTDYSPATNGACRLGLTPPSGPLGNGYGTCAASICVMPLFLQLVNEAAWFLCPGLRCTQDNARTTTLLSPTHTPVPLFPAADECNATHILDGTIPFAPT
jgi:hypothetical protein